MGKRLFDLLCALSGLVVLAPVWLVIAVFIKLDTTGPVFFRQTRVGRHGKPFDIHKFRTMRDAATLAGDDLLITLHNDPRVTRTGRWLRRTKLDELPQLIDVVCGHMSLVGPRPEVPRYVALYPAALREKILSVRPGITDPASLMYRDESKHLADTQDPEQTYLQTLMPAKLQIAAHYVDHATLWWDLRLIASTLKALLWR